MEVIDRTLMQAAPQSESNAKVDRTSQPKLAAELGTAMDRLWERFLPEIRSRADLLSAAAADFATAPLPIAQREAAHAAAHKLAGTLGTFSLARGTELARELEQAFAVQIEPDPMLATRLAFVAGELRTIIDDRK
jgi:HPt (histidine-containing phosphotransfer) domain-containing protein